ncbi:CinA family protein [Rhodopila sp.]|uniref:CinA family protein n=1 Tax=Rhodopila sp. TaxID=2480087 RepID=UPI003D0D6E0C
MDLLLPLAEKIGARLKQRNQTIGIAESSTGGLLSAALLSVGGASAYFRGGGVIYTAYARKAFLDIPNPLPAPIERASTEPYARLLADTVRTRLDASWGLGETGATGPTGNRYGDQAGHTCIAVTGANYCKVITLETGSTDRVANMRAFGIRALELLAEAIA